MRVVDYDPSRRGDVADLMGRVWGTRPDEAELEWFYEGNPVGPASVLLAEEAGAVVGSVAISFQPVGGDVVGFAVHLATDPAYRGRGVFRELMTANEERARAAGVPYLLTVPTRASARILGGALGWTRLPPLRVWARPRLPGSARAQSVERFGDPWLDWRFADAPRPYRLLAGRGRAVVGRRGRFGTVLAVEDGVLGDACAAAAGPAVVAIPPRAGRGRFLRQLFVPTPKTFTLLGKASNGTLPSHVDLQLGDLDFF